MIDSPQQAPQTPAEADVCILLVDDRQDNLDVLEALLDSGEYRLLKATSGRQALELLLQHDVALALLDVHMPGMDGFELAELMRGAARTRNVPIIFVTASTPAVDRIFRGYEAGGVDFLFKPINQHLLQSKVSIFIDLFRQRQLLSRQVAAHKALLRTSELLIGVLSHDLRAPLSAVVLAADLLARGQPDNASVAQLTGRIKSASGRMARLIEQLLDFAAARTGGLPVRPQPADLHHLCQSAFAEFQAHRDRLKLCVAGDPKGTWDPDRLQQVLTNLIGNAVQHGDADRDVIVSVIGSGHDTMVVRVENDGTIPEAIRGELFSPFVHHARGGTHGTGLGLYIVDQIARAHGGRAMADCTNNRTAVTVQVPRHVPASTRPAEVQS